MYTGKPAAWLACVALICLTAVLARAQQPAGLPARLPTPPPAPEQPLPYSHRQHLDLALVDCVDCHVQPDPGTAMTFPATDICMSCHESQAASTPALQALRRHATSGTPIPWVRVYQLPAYVYWSHATHLDVGIGCADCHGPVAELDAMRQLTNVASKNGCVTCHEARQTFIDCGDCHEPRQ